MDGSFDENSNGAQFSDTWELVGCFIPSISMVI